MLQRLEDAEFNGERITEGKAHQLTRQAEGLLDLVQELAHQDND